MQAQILGNSVDDCVSKSLEKLRKCEDFIIETPVSVCLTNPLARFSFLPDANPAIGVTYGICALAGVNDDYTLDEPVLPKNITEAFKRAMQGPCLRGYDPGWKTGVSFRTAPGFIGSTSVGTNGRIDQLHNAVEFLKAWKWAKIVLHDPVLVPDESGDMPCMPSMANLYIDGNNNLCMTVYVDHLEIMEGFALYVAPVFTFIQQMIAALIDAGLGCFTVIAESMSAWFGKQEHVDYERDIADILFYLKSFKKIPPVGKELYGKPDGKPVFDLRYVDNALRYLGDFAHRVQQNDLMITNPFVNNSPLRVFYDYAEVLRAAEAIKQEMEVKGASIFLHPHLAHYYDV